MKAKKAVPRDVLLQRKFMTRTALMFKHMRERFAEKKNKNGRVIRIGRVVPFTLEELRGFVRAHFPADGNWVTQCPYCPKPLTIEEVTGDHAVPVSRGGGLDLLNLVLCHGEDNRIKGKLNVSEYRALMEGLRTFPDAARNDILSRLKVGAGFTRLRYMSKKAAPIAAAISEEDF